MLAANAEDVPVRPETHGTILVISAGTSDIPVADEAFVTARCLGNAAEKIYDVLGRHFGVAADQAQLAKTEDSF